MSGGVKTQELVYRIVDGRELKALIFTPDDEGHALRPAVVCLHGGAWISGDRTLPTYMAEKLAARGFVVMSIDFRMAPAHMYPTSLRDANYAIRWLRRHAPEYRIDTDCVGGLGFSSGGHLVLLSAMGPDRADYMADLPDELGNYSARLDWVVSCSGVLDPLARYRMAQAAGYAEIIACHDKYFGSEACMREANPPLMLERGESAVLPPLLMFQGGADPRLPADTATRMAALYCAAGGEAEAFIYPAQGHALSEWPEAQQNEVADRILAFSRQVGLAARQ
jgi:acetyl esterase/lipase